MLLKNKILTVVLVLVVVWLGRAAWNLHFQRAAIATQVSDLEVKVAHVQQENRFLASSSAYFQSNEYLEKQARLKLNYKLPDENVAYIYPDTSSHSAVASASAGFLAGWKNWFGGLFK